MLTTKDILELLNIIAPFDIAEEWDNSGFQVGDLNREVKKIIVGLDVTMSLMKEAKQGKFDLVLTHHPLMMKFENSIDFNKMPGSAIEIAAQNKIGIISVHTNLDKANDGLNDYFAAKIGVQDTRAFIKEDHSSMPSEEAIGMGRIGYLKCETKLKQLGVKIKEKFGLNYLRVTGDMQLPVKKIAICTGSGGSLTDRFLKSGADVYITGDIKYHEARRVEEYKKGLIDVGHFGSEHIAVDLLADKLSQAIQKAGQNIQIIQFKKEKDPFTIV
ncbi:MAG: Nif3-like dinuclear metal center hexameric protein [Desulfobacteraceae bacterium]|nr:Nif3-like dinuclear metal center hexameric protein [Desulfobacteraceae bacterium]